MNRQNLIFFSPYANYDRESAIPDDLHESIQSSGRAWLIEVNSVMNGKNQP